MQNLSSASVVIGTLRVKGLQVLINFQNYDVSLSLKVLLNLANSAYPDEMYNYFAFHLCLHALSKYPFRGFQYSKG